MIEVGTHVRVKLIGTRAEVGGMYAIASIKEDYLGYGFTAWIFHPSIILISIQMLTRQLSLLTPGSYHYLVVYADIWRHETNTKIVYQTRFYDITPSIPEGGPVFPSYSGRPRASRLRARSGPKSKPQNRQVTADL